MTAESPPELTSVLRWLSKLAGALTLLSAAVAGLAGYRLYQAQQDLRQLSDVCGSCCDAEPPSGRAATMPPRR